MQGISNGNNRYLFGKWGRAMKPKSLLSAILVSLLATACVTPTETSPRPDLLGSPAAPTAATRTIVIQPDTRWVNVTGGEIIKFVVGNQVFTWNFNTSPTVGNFDLRQAAPAGVFDHQVQAYVAPNPLYLGGDGHAGRGGGHGGGRR